MRSEPLALLCVAVLVSTVTSCGGDSTGPAQPARLVFTVQPSAATAGAAFAPSPQVTVQDGSGNVVSSSTLSITIALATGAGTAGAHLRGRATVSAVNGVAVFNGLSIDSAGPGYVLTAGTSGVPTASSAAFAVTAAPAQVLAFVVQPSNAVAATAISPAISVSVRDSVGNLVTGATTSATIAITAGTGTAGAVLSGTLTQVVLGGTATFDNLRIDKSGTYTLTASVSSTASATSSSFGVRAGTATKLAIAVQPSSVVAGSSITPAVQVAVQDAQGNTVTGSTASVTVAITSGTGKAGANLQGTSSVAATAGVATFAGLSIDSAGTGYTLTATAGGLSGAASSPFAVSVGPATRLGFVAQPAAAYATWLIVPAVQVAVLDAGGNRVTSSTATVTLAITLGTGAAGAVLGGTLGVAAASGLASFTDLTVNSPGSGYTLTATSGVLGAARSQLFDIGPKPIARALAAGFYHTCAVSVAGAAYCWGFNSFGPLGDGTTTLRTTPVAVSGGLLFQSISAGIYHTCGLTASGAAYCWGNNASGQLGDGTTSNRTSPVAVSGGLVFQAISAGDDHTCGLTASGAAYCWGINVSGQLGDGTTSSRTSPVAVSGGLLLQAISAGYEHTCGLTASGAAYCWGSGYLGDGAGSHGTTPVAVSGELVFRAISAGWDHTCGLTTAGTAYCWGFNAYGPIGDGTTSDRDTPVAVSGGLLFQSISIGYHHTCGVTTGGTAYCWGGNDHGQLGDGTTINRTSPVAVSGGLVFQAIDTGYYLHSCGVTTGGAVYCWGLNVMGQLGDGTTTDRLSPMRVFGF